MRTALEIVFWICAGSIAWTQLGYALVLAVLTRVAVPLARGPSGSPEAAPLPAVSLIVAAHDEQASIEAKIANALALDYPQELIEVIVACDGCADETAHRARAAGATIVLELPRGGKIRAQDAAVARASGEIVAFSDANSLWEPDALRSLVAVFATESRTHRGQTPRRTRPWWRGRTAPTRVGYACGQVRFVQTARGAGATSQEGLYWRYEMAVRARESRLSSITAGNGAIYATRREAYIVVDPIMGHDLSFPFNLVKRGWRAVYVPEARASEPMVPSIEGELARKRRMMSHTWPIVLRGGMLDPRGYPPGYALMILSHRVLRYATPFLHVLALAANIAIVAVDGKRTALYMATLALQVALFAAAGLGGAIGVRPLLIARYYVLTTAAPALGLWDWLRHGTNASWEAAEGTRPSAPPPRAAEGAR
jgi:hypothetical protein